MEWESIETPVSDSEKKILKVIMDGYDHLNIRFNENQSLLQISRITPSGKKNETNSFSFPDKSPTERILEDAKRPKILSDRCNLQETTEIESYLYTEYFAIKIEELLNQLRKPNSASAETKKEKKSTTKAVKFPENPEVAHWIHVIEEWKTKNAATISAKKMKKADQFRIENIREMIHSQKRTIFEYVLLEFCEKIILHSTLSSTKKDFLFAYYTLIQIKNANVPHKNAFVMSFVDFVLLSSSPKVHLTDVFQYSYEIIEKNHHLLKYADICLYPHQKQLFSIFRGGTGDGEHPPTPQLVLYMAPTGTGKTMSPIGLSKEYRIIFVCVARHVGLALAKSAISMGKKTAFAFGCETASDIRLHFYSAVDYVVNYRSGGIHKVDNSVGSNVEIMICDVKSYLTAMHYMLAFNREDRIITYWDEPTITMDYENHELHEIIHNNWAKNKISKMVLSCATLPKEREIMDTLADFRTRFEGAQIHTITSFDCKKTISILNKEGRCALPHLLFSNYEELQDCVHYCEENKTLLRYFDLREIIRLILFVDRNRQVEEAYRIEHYFESVSGITMDSIKLYYLEVLKHLPSHHWNHVFQYITSTQTEYFQDAAASVAKKTGAVDPIRKIRSVDTSVSSMAASASEESKPLVRSVSVMIPPPLPTTSTDAATATSAAAVAASLPPSNPAKGILLTTVDAHTLTDGPTIFLVEDAQKIGKFYIQQSKIPEKVFSEIMEKIRENDEIQKRITVLEKAFEDSLGNEIEKEKKMEKDQMNRDTREVLKQLEAARSRIKSVSMESKYIPNMKQHQMLWIPDGRMVENAFVPSIDDQTVKNIMSVNVDQQMKLLLLLGIGVFTNQPNIQYMEIMKKLAAEQRLYIIIAQSDYIYGTNYQFCHGFIGKDLCQMTQQKTIQAIGRIGRNNIQQEYTVRFREDKILSNLFRPITENQEAINMSRLFCSHM